MGRLLLIKFLLMAITSAALAQPPNVIVIMTDDTGNNIGYQGNPYVTTPHIDSLAIEGVSLSNFHQMPMCTASRAGLMSGQYAEHTGAWRTSLGRTMMRGDVYTIAEAFRDNGYATAHYGKWHLGDNWPMAPQDQGFNDVVGLRCGGIGQIADYWGNDYFDDTYYRNGKPEKFDGYWTDVFFNETMRFIRGKKDEPFFIYLAPNITHLPLKVAEKYSKKHVDNGIDEKLAILYGMIDNLDENMGRLLACLRETGVDEKTIILMTTDDGVQGASISRTPDYWNMGMRGKKGSQEEGGHRVFSYLRWTGGNIGTPGVNNDTLISIQDVYPTMLDLCGLPMPENIEFSGRSFKPYLTSPLNPEEDDRLIFFYYYNPKKIDQRENQTCVIWKNWRLIANTQLYDISKDKMQENDVAIDYPEVVKKLQVEFDDYHAIGKPLIKEPVRFIIGDPRALVQELTSQDVYWTQGISSGQAFGQGDCEKLEQAHGPYKVTIARDGKYTFTLSRYPLYTGMTFGESHRSVGTFHIEKVRMSIAGQTVEKAVTPEDTHARFTLDLKAGDANLDTALIGDGNDGVAYFVTIEFSGESS